MFRVVILKKSIIFNWNIFALMIILQGRDLVFAQIAQGARVDGATLPSGLKVPVTPGMKWIIDGETIRSIEETNNQINVQVQIPE